MTDRQFRKDVAAPREQVFDLWANAPRSPEWIEGLTRVGDILGPLGQAGTRYSIWFGRTRGTVEILVADRPRSIGWRVRTGILSAEIHAEMEASQGGTRMIETIRTRGPIMWIWARILATGARKGSFRGELAAFARICEREFRGDGGIESAVPGG